jgi:hypothetical protein
MFLDDYEAELMAKFKALTPEQLAEAEARRQEMKAWDAAHTAIEDPASIEENEEE